MTDLISRADAIRVISEEYHNRGGNFDGLDAVRELETLPSKGGDAEVNETKSPYMQHSRHDDGRLTREKAVKWVKFVHDVLYEDKDEEIREALNMAIEALKADAVSRKDTVTLNSPISIQAEMVAVVRCKDCRHLDVWNLKNIYAVCSKHGITFEPFEDDTRTHFCSWGERRKE